MNMTSVDGSIFHAELVMLANLTNANVFGGKIIMYIHGGGLVGGSAAGYRRVASWLARFAQVPVLVPDYRLSPEHKWPRSVEDVFSAYRYLVDKMHFSQQNIIIGGDSAGGGLTALLLIFLRDNLSSRYKMPGGAFFVSPYTDLSFGYPSIDANQATDPLVRKIWLQGMVKVVLDSANSDFERESPLTARDPSISPYYAELNGLPPLYMIVTEQEIMRDDGVRFIEKAKRQGAMTRLDILFGMHAMLVFADYLEEGKAVLRLIASFSQKPEQWVASTS